MGSDPDETADDVTTARRWQALGLVGAALLLIALAALVRQPLLLSQHLGVVTEASVGWMAAALVVRAACRMAEVERAAWMIIGSSVALHASGVSVGFITSITGSSLALPLHIAGAILAGVLSAVILARDQQSVLPGLLDGARPTLDLAIITGSITLVGVVLTPLMSLPHRAFGVRGITSLVIDLALFGALLPLLLIRWPRAGVALAALFGLTAGVRLLGLVAPAAEIGAALPPPLESLRMSLCGVVATYWPGGSSTIRSSSEQGREVSFSPIPSILLWLAVATLAGATTVPAPLLLGLLIAAALRARLYARVRRLQLRQWQLRIQAAHEATAAGQEQIHRLAQLIHDQAAPLSGLDRIQRDLEGAGVHSWARRIGDHLSLLLTLTNQQRAVVSEQRPPQPRALVKIAVVPIVEAAIDAAQLRAQLTRVALSSALNSHHPYATVLGDPASLRRVLDNLISNALDATAAGGQVIVELWDDRQHPAWLTITVHDSGRGLSTAAQAAADALDVPPARQAGMGLGLGIVRELTAAMGGTYGVERNSRGGSDVWIRLQRAEPACAATPP